MRIGICAPGARLERDAADQVIAIAAREFPQATLVFSEQCFASHGHFAGPDEQRCASLIALANDPEIDAIWFARGGYGACRIAERVIENLGPAAGQKSYLGYSDMGNLLGALYKAGIGSVAHGPMPADIGRENGGDAITCALGWLVDRNPDALAAEARSSNQPCAAFNLVTLAAMTGTALLPDLAGHVLMVEEVGEHLYAVDRALFNVTSHFADKAIAGLRLGRISAVPANDRPFGENPEAMAQRWCTHYGIAYLGRADIGHDAGNKIVPFGEP